MKRITHSLSELLKSWGLKEHLAQEVNALILIVLFLIVVLILDDIIKRVLWKVAASIAKRTQTQFDDILLQNRFSRNLAHLFSLGIATFLIPYALAEFPDILEVVLRVLKVLGIVFALWIVRSILNTIKDFLKTLESYKDKPIDSYIQVFMIFAWLTGLVLAFAVLTGNPIIKFFTVFGATSAVLLLVFRDTILGFVASIQVSINDMVRIGDWITFEKFAADGDVIEINLATVKVQNFDKTITTIPTYALISDSFRNWRGMMNSDGRRIKRAVYVKQSSIHFLDKKQIEELQKIQLISKYLQTKTDEIDRFNERLGADKSSAINGRNLTNIGVFRKYIESYIENHSAINKDMIIMVRQLQATPHGLPIEIYAFSADKRWENYEFIMADIFDHVFASASFFNLELYEMATGDFNKAKA
jgi:miniconductance mechanosensitive channel